MNICIELFYLQINTYIYYLHTHIHVYKSRQGDWWFEIHNSGKHMFMEYFKNDYKKGKKTLWKPQQNCVEGRRVLWDFGSAVEQGRGKFLNGKKKEEIVQSQVNSLGSRKKGE